MFGGSSRRIWLIALAIINLVLWLVVAVGVCLLAGDKMNLGLERYLRGGEATDVAHAGQPARPGTGPGSAGSPGVQASVTAAQPPAAAQTPSPVGTSGPQPVAGSGTPVPAPGAQGATAQLSGTLVSSPLILSDPDSDSLAQVDFEMAHSTIGRPVQIQYGEAALNREIAAWVAQSSELGFRNVQVSLEPDQAVVTGDVTVLGFDVGARLQGVVLVENCLPRVEIQTVSVGGFLTPGFVKDQVAAMVLEALDQYPPDSPLCLERIVLEDGVVTVYGHRR